VTSLSRPFQVVLAVFALLVALWFVALRAHNSGSSEPNSGSSASQPAKPATHQQSGAEGGSQKTTGSATAAQPTVTHASTGDTGSVEHTATAPKGAAKQATSTSSVPAKQREVEHELSQHRTVLILFWNPRAAEDRAVHNELPAVQRKLGKKIAVHYAGAKQVGDFGSVTHAVRVNQTPTLLIVNPQGQTTTRTGLIDAYAIKQAVSEAGETSSEAGK
jgi:hypothetical protein